MALDKKISDLSAVTSFADADLFTLVHSSANYNVTWVTTKGLIHDYLATQDAAFSVAQSITATTNQLVLGTTNTVTLNSIAPAASRVYSINKDIGAAANFVLAKGSTAKWIMFDISSSTSSKLLTLACAHTDDRTITFPDATGTVAVTGQAPSFTNITLTNTTNQMVLGTTNTTTISATAPASSAVYTIADVGTTATFVMNAGTLTIGGAKTFSSALTINPTTNQLVLGVTNTVTINSIAPAASRVYSINYDIAAAANFVLAKGSTAKQMLFDISSSTDSKTLTLACAHTDDRTITFPDTTGTVAVSGQSPSFASETLTNTTNQLVLGTTNTVTLNSIAPAASRVYSINYDIAAAANFVLAKGSTAKQMLFDISSSTDSKTLTLACAHTDDRTLTFPDATGTVAVSGQAASFTTGTFTATSNQFVLGTTNTTTISATAPASSAVYTIADVGTTADFVMSAGNLTIGGSKTFSSAVTINPTTNQLVLGVTNTVTINSVAPAASRVYSINYDIAAAANFVLAKGTTAKQMLFDISSSTDSKTLTLACAHTDDRTITFPDATGTVAVTGQSPSFAAVTVTGTTNQFVLGTTNTVTVNSIAPAASRVYSINYDIAAAANFVLAKGSTAKQMLFDISSSTDSKTLTLACAHTDDRTLTFPDATGTVIVSGQSASLTSGTLTNTTNQLVLGTTNTVTINSIAPAASRVYSINYDITAAANFVLAKGSTAQQMLFDISGSTNSKTLTLACAHTDDRTITFPDATGTVAVSGQSPSFAAVTVTGTTNQLVLGTTNTTTISAIAPSSSTTLSIQDYGTPANIIQSLGSTVKKVKFDATGSTDSKTMTIESKHTDDRTLTLPNVTANLAYDIETAHTTTLQGIWASAQAITVGIVGTNAFTILHFPSVVATANTGTTITLTAAIPSGYRPASALDIPIWVEDNNSWVAGNAVIGTDGTVTIGVGHGGNFAGSGTSGIAGFSVSFG